LRDLLFVWYDHYMSETRIDFTQFNTRHDQVVGYSYNAADFCAECMYEHLPMSASERNTLDAMPGSAVALIGALAAARGIDTHDLYTYDSADYPKALVAGDVDDDRCSVCGVPLLGGVMDMTGDDVTTDPEWLDENYPDRLPTGTRVRHWNEQFLRATTYGTATVVGYERYNRHLNYTVSHDNPAELLHGRSRVWNHGDTVKVNVPQSVPCD
jgi:hypothetical protein